MKILFVFTLLFCSFLTLASPRDCYKEQNQSDKNECMLFERDRAVGRVMTEVTEYCADQDEIRAAQKGTHYLMLLDECMAKELNNLARDVEEED